MFPEAPTHHTDRHPADRRRPTGAPSSRSLPPLAAGVVVILAACAGGDAAASGPPQVEGEAIGVAGAHEHGIVRFGIAVDGTAVTLEGEAPAQALFRFERAPATDDERALATERVRQLRADAGSLVSFAESNRCYVSAISVDVPEVLQSDEGPHAHADPGEGAAPTAGDPDGVEDEHDHEEDDHVHDEDDHAHDEDDHLEVQLSVRWSCEISPEGYPATVQVSRLIPGAERVDLTVVTSRGSGGARVGADSAFRF